MDVLDLGGGVGLINCVECGGDGDWTKFHPESDALPVGSLPCINCKGTGKRYIGFWPLPTEDK